MNLQKIMFTDEIVYDCCIDENVAEKKLTLYFPDMGFARADTIFHTSSLFQELRFLTESGQQYGVTTEYPVLKSITVMEPVLEEKEVLQEDGTTQAVTEEVQYTIVILGEVDLAQEIKSIKAEQEITAQAVQDLILTTMNM